MKRRSIRKRFFTDRSIYRPQIVYQEYAPGTENGAWWSPVKTEVTLRDANGQEISVQRLQSNEYGPCRKNLFSPPASCRKLFLVAEGGSTHFRGRIQASHVRNHVDTVRQTYNLIKRLTSRQGSELLGYPASARALPHHAPTGARSWSPPKIMSMREKPAPGGCFQLSHPKNRKKSTFLHPLPRWKHP